MRVCIYVRVSKEELGLQEPENQLGPLREYCMNRGWDVRDTFIDRASGGNSNRPEFQKMLGRVRQSFYSAVVVWALDRFSREGMSNTLSYIKQMKQYNCGLISYQEPWLDTTQQGVGELLLAIMSWVAAEEKKRISERTKAGLDRLRSKGVKLGRPFKLKAPLQ
jgi:DNA invertase Pin-like site-specific DNA recombinase